MSEIKLKRAFYPGTYDVIFKGLLLQNKDITCFMYNQLFPNEPITPEEITYVNENVIDGVEFKTITTDIRFNVFSNNNIVYADIEMQKNYIKNYTYRNDLYTSKIMCEGNKPGEEYNIKNILTISICEYDVLKNKKWLTIIQPNDIEDINGYRYHWRKNVYLQLPYINKCDKIKLTSIIEILKSDKPDDMRGDDPFMNKVIDEIKKLNQDPNTRALINMLEIKEMDEITLRKMAREEGREEGRIEGHAIGHTEGVNEATLKIAKALKEVNTPIDVITSATGLSKEKVEKL